MWIPDELQIGKNIRNNFGLLFIDKGDKYHIIQHIFKLVWTTTIYYYDSLKHRSKIEKSLILSQSFISYRFQIYINFTEFAIKTQLKLIFKCNVLKIDVPQIELKSLIRITPNKSQNILTILTGNHFKKKYFRWIYPFIQICALFALIKPPKELTSN